MRYEVQDISDKEAALFRNDVIVLFKVKHLHLIREGMNSLECSISKGLNPSFL